MCSNVFFLWHCNKCVQVCASVFFSLALTVNGFKFIKICLNVFKYVQTFSFFDIYSKCVRICSNMFKYVQMFSFLGLYGKYVQMCLNVFKYLQMCLNVFKYPQMCSNTFKCVQLSKKDNVFKCVQMFSFFVICSKCVQMFSFFRIYSKCVQMCLNVFKCIQMFLSLSFTLNVFKYDQLFLSVFSNWVAFLYKSVGFHNDSVVIERGSTDILLLLLPRFYVMLQLFLLGITPSIRAFKLSPQEPLSLFFHTFC